MDGAGDGGGWTAGGVEKRKMRKEKEERGGWWQGAETERKKRERGEEERKKVRIFVLVSLSYLLVSLFALHPVPCPQSVCPLCRFFHSCAHSLPSPLTD